VSESDAARSLLREVLAEVLAGNGAAPSPMVPPPPVAAVHRPSSWGGPGAGARTEVVRIESDADLAAFASALLARAAVDGPAIVAGQLRFTLGRTATAGPATPSGAVRVEAGAVTERTVKKAAEAGARIVLGPAAVLTPLARERARALGIDIERES
jgi:hypothetical protein